MGLEEDQEVNVESDLFQEMSNEMNHDDKLCKEVLSSLADGLLKVKLDPADKSLSDKYPRPENI